MKLVAPAQLDALAHQASISARGRAHLALHAGKEDRVQRFFVAADCRSYFRPHRHQTRSELALVVRGSFDLLVFETDGTLRSRTQLAADGNALAYETPTGWWHTLLARSNGSVFLEVKEGPYDPVSSAEFAIWAPPEGGVGVERFQQWLESAQPGDRFND